MDTWLVELGGSRFDLEELCEPQAALRVSESNGHFYLEDQSLQSLTDANVVLDAARQLVSALNGLGTLHLQAWEPVHVKGVSRRTEDGRIHQFIFASTIRGRSKCSATLTGIHVGGAPVPTPPSQMQRDLASVATDAKASSALRWLGQHGPTWGNLYRILELVRDDVGRTGIQGNAWATTSELDNFTHTANHPHAAGEDSRHAVNKQKPPNNPMPLAVARTLIIRILRRWISSRQQP